MRRRRFGLCSDYMGALPASVVVVMAEGFTLHDPAPGIDRPIVYLT